MNGRKRRERREGKKKEGEEQKSRKKKGGKEEERGSFGQKDDNWHGSVWLHWLRQRSNWLMYLVVFVCVRELGFTVRMCQG
jgi:hypothetical protein